MSRLPDIENRTVLPHAEPNDAVPERDKDDGGHWRQLDADIRAIARETAKLAQLRFAKRQAW